MSNYVHMKMVSYTFNDYSGTRDGMDVLGDALVTASGDSKVNMWSIGMGKLVWSNHRSDAR